MVSQNVSVGNVIIQVNGDAVYSRCFLQYIR